MSFYYFFVFNFAIIFLNITEKKEYEFIYLFFKKNYLVNSQQK